MKTTSILAAAFSASAASAQYFGVISVRSGSPIQYLPMNAGGGDIYLGGQADTYCPDSVQSAGGCPAGNDTNFAGGNNTISLGAEVPGGQQVYIDPACGALSYTQAHSVAMPEGAIVTGWSITQGASYGTLSHEGGLVACNEDNVWKVYAQVNGLTFPDSCLGFDALTGNETSPAAWQYTK